jgi:hypothetical protein
MHPMVRQMLVSDHIDQLRREADSDRLARTARPSRMERAGVRRHVRWALRRLVTMA